MSESHHASDRKAAFTGLILGVIALAIVLSTIVYLTNRHYAGKEGARPRGAPPQKAAVPLPSVRRAPLRPRPRGVVRFDARVTGRAVAARGDLGPCRRGARRARAARVGALVLVRGARAHGPARRLAHVSRDPPRALRRRRGGDARDRDRDRAAAAHRRTGHRDHADGRRDARALCGGAGVGGRGGAGGGGGRARGGAPPAPRLAHRARGDATEDVAAEAVVIGDILLVRPGEMVPCDGILIEGNSHVEVARLTGEPSPQHVIEGSIVRSGAVNVESAFRLRVTAPSRESLYAKIVELVRTAQAEKSPIQRLADRYAVWFTPVTLAACGIAWLAAGDPLRVLAVLVVATPCPLILATPVAIVGGINRAARHQIVVRTGGALEQIGAVAAAVFDKPGTLTIGYPEVSHVLPLAPFDERTLLALAAAVEHHSGHLLAITTVDAAESLGIAAPAAQP